MRGLDKYRMLKLCLVNYKTILWQFKCGSSKDGGNFAFEFCLSIVVTTYHKYVRVTPAELKNNKDPGINSILL